MEAAAECGEDGTEEAMMALEEADSSRPATSDIPPDVANICTEFGRRIKKMQFEAASYYVCHAENKLQTTPPFWRAILRAIAQLAVNEHLYVGLPSLQRGKKEAELRKQFASSLESLSLLATQQSAGSVPLHIAEQCKAFTTARLRLVDCHRSFAAALESSRVAGLMERVGTELDEVVALSANFHHPLLSELHHNYLSEVELLRSVLLILASIRKLDVMESLVRLKDMRERLQFWQKEVDHGVEVKRGFFQGFRSSSSSRSTDRLGHCRLVAYLDGLHLFLGNKFFMYFGEALSPFCSPLELKTMQMEQLETGNGSGLSFAEVSLELRKREKDAVFALILDRLQEKSQFYGLSYRGEDAEEKDPLTGLAGFYPLLFVYAPDRSQFVERLYPCVATFVQEQLGGAAAGTRAHTVDKEAAGGPRHITFFGECVEASVHAVLVVSGKRAERDAVPSRFLSALTAALRGTAIVTRFRER